jgi:CheY-like chemotaxis protein
MKKHILLIDDDKNEFTTFMLALKNINSDYHCAYAERSEQALDMLKYIQPDFIFIDYNLPNVNGLQVLSVIRNEPRLQRTKIYIYTETISEEVDKMARLLGADGCIEKNATIGWLTHLFKAIFDGELMPKYAIMRNPSQAGSLGSLFTS